MPKIQSGKYKEITVKDIAKACGVSATTVFRVLSKSNYPVRTEVRNTVFETVLAAEGFHAL